ncbi:DUF1772 domain-containing protein [Zhihengliuella alba]|uniref:DUF1772 domain-containing protein n=1 Tax=Zhihengliuella alba TaxID=547018 RepID=A0ABP7DF87_9MICC
MYCNFSFRVMPRLAALAPADGILRMQGFNRNAVRPPFMAAFFGAALLSVLLAVRAVTAGPGTAAPVPGALLVGGAVLYLAGFVLTVVYHVPRNESLARLDPRAAGAVPVWRAYLREWTRANTVRAVLSTGSAAVFCAAAVLSA